MNVKADEFQRLNNNWREVVDTIRLNSSHLSDPRKIDEYNEQANRVIRLSKKRSKYISTHQVSLEFQDIFEDTLRELKVIPTKWIAILLVKMKTIQQTWERGFGGKFDLFLMALGLILFFMLPYFVLIGVRVLTDRLEAFKRKLVTNPRRTYFQDRLALWLQRFTVYVPWGFSYLLLEVVYLAARESFIGELVILIPYFQYFCLYRISLRLVSGFLSIFYEYGFHFTSYEIRQKISRLSKKVSLYFFINLVVIYSIKSIVGTGLLYSGALKLSFIAAVILLFQEIARWKEDYNKVLVRLNDKFNPDFKGRVFPFTLVLEPAFFLISILGPSFLKLVEYLSEFSFMRKIQAKVFQKKLESSKSLSPQAQTELPQEYQKIFSYKLFDEELLINPGRDCFDAISIEIDEWLNEVSDEHSLAIYGPKGAGKTTLLKRLEKKYQNIKAYYCEPSDKILTEIDVFRFISKILGEEINGVEDLLNFDKSTNENHLIIIDECQSFFLARLGGFEGYKAFIKVINLRTEKIFWCASFNEYSWDYLEQVFSRNRYFRNTFSLKGWEEDDIKNLITKRHNLTGYKLTYADIIKASRSSDEKDSFSYVESQFFRLLWDESKGNPRAALYLWLSCLSIIGNKRLKVGLPFHPEIASLERLGDEINFVMASLIRHDSLTTKELCEVTSLSEGVVRYCLKLGLEKEFLVRGELGRYRVSPTSQVGLVKFLKGKNLIYG